MSLDALNNHIVPRGITFINSNFLHFITYVDDVCCVIHVPSGLSKNLRKILVGLNSVNFAYFERFKSVFGYCHSKIEMNKQIFMSCFMNNERGKNITLHKE